MHSEGGGRHGDLARLASADIVSTESEREGCCAISAVSSSQDVSGVDQRATAEVHAVDTNGNLPLINKFQYFNSPHSTRSKIKYD